MQSRSMSVVFFENDWEHTARSGIFKILDANDERLPSKMIIFYTVCKMVSVIL